MFEKKKKKKIICIYFSVNVGNKLPGIHMGEIFENSSQFKGATVVGVKPGM